MSGPKYSRAIIREAQRLQRLQRQLEEQMEQEKRKQVLEDISRLEKIKKSYCCDRVVADCENLIPHAEQLIPDSKILNEIKELVKSINTANNQKCSLNGDSTELIKKCNELRKEVEKLNNYLRILKELKPQISVEGTAALQEKRSQEFENTNWVDTEEKIDTIPLDLQEIYIEVIELLAKLPDFAKNKELIDSTIMKTGDNEYKKRQLETRKNAIIVEINSSQDNLKQLSLTTELRSLYSILGWEAKSIPVEISELESAVSEARQEAKKRQENEYIAECLHKVFEEKGYLLAEDIVLTCNGSDVKKQFYEFGEDALINVSHSDSGQLLFEVVGDGTDSDMDDARASKLESEMRRFCPNYAEIKKMLLDEYGISLEDEHLCEADKKYAKAVDVSKNRSERRAKKEKKMMRNDD